MSHVYDGVDSNPTSVTLPDDGDPKNAASVNVPFEAIWDRLTHINLPEQDPTKSPLIASRSLNIAQKGHVWYDPSQWGQVTAKPSIAQLSATATYVSIDLQLPHGSVCTEMYVYITPAGFHTGLPGTMPSWTIYVRDPITGADTSLDSHADTSGSVLAYETYHAVGHHISVPFTVDRAKRYWLVFNGEGGANAEAGMVFESVAGVSTVAALDVGAA